MREERRMKATCIEDFLMYQKALKAAEIVAAILRGPCDGKATDACANSSRDRQRPFRR